MKVGSIVEVKSFCDYVVKVPIENDDGYMPVSRIPAGTYVSIRSGQGTIVGIVTSVHHNIKEEYLPFLSTEKQEIFAPYVSDFRNSYLSIRGIGNLLDGKAQQSLVFAPVVNDMVDLMDKESIRAFHISEGKPSFTYYKKIAQDLNADTICSAIDKVTESVPECKQMLMALKKYTENHA